MVLVIYATAGVLNSRQTRDVEGRLREWMQGSNQQLVEYRLKIDYRLIVCSSSRLPNLMKTAESLALVHCVSHNHQPWVFSRSLGKKRLEGLVFRIVVFGGVEQ